MFHSYDVTLSKLNSQNFETFIKFAKINSANQCVSKFGKIKFANITSSTLVITHNFFSGIIFN